MYDSFDYLPILNWHNFLKTNDFIHLFRNKEDKKKYSEKQIIKKYEILINSLGNNELLNGYYAKVLHNSLLFFLEKTAKLEQQYNNSFFAYLRLLNKSISEINIEGKIFYSTIEAYNFYRSKKTHFEALQQRIYDFHYNNFKQKEYDFDLFNDIAMLENYLKRTIDPQSISVNHYNAIKKQALKSYNMRKNK